MSQSHAMVAPEQPADVVRIRIPASGAYLSVLRTATASLASRLDFTLDEIEDLRIAVDEACALLLVDAIAGTDLTCEFELDDAGMRIVVSVLSEHGLVPRRDTWAWTVLTALAGEIDARIDSDNRVSIDLYKTRQGAPR